MELETHRRVSVPFRKPFASVSARAIRRLTNDGDITAVSRDAVNQLADLIFLLSASERRHFNDRVFTSSKTFERLELGRFMKQKSHDDKHLSAQALSNVQRPPGGDPRDTTLDL